MIDNETEYHSFVYAKNQFCNCDEKMYGWIFTNLNIAKKFVFSWTNQKNTK